MNVSSRTLNKVDIFCKLNSQCSFYVGIISVENLCIIEQNNGSEVCNVIDSVISKAFKFHAKGEYFLEKISYNSFIFVIIDENLKLTISVIENIINFINKRDNFLKMKNVFFLTRIGLAEHTNLKDLNITHSQAQTALFECSSEKKIYSFYRTSLNTIQKHINNTDLLANYLEAYENRKLEFDFDKIAVLGFEINLGKGKAAELGSASGLGSKNNENLIKNNKKPFFNWISADDKIATARGGGGGLALWKRVDSNGSNVSTDNNVSRTQQSSVLMNASAVRVEATIDENFDGDTITVKSGKQIRYDEEAGRFFEE